MVHTTHWHPQIFELDSKYTARRQLLCCRAHSREALCSLLLSTQQAIFHPISWCIASWLRGHTWGIKQGKHVFVDSLLFVKFLILMTQFMIWQTCFNQAFSWVCWLAVTCTDLRCISVVDCCRLEAVPSCRTPLSWVRGASRTGRDRTSVSLVTARPSSPCWPMCCLA